MRILFLTKSKKYTIRLLKDLVENGDAVTVVCKDYNSFLGSEMESYCREHSITYYDNNDLYDALGSGSLPVYDLAVSNTYGRLIKKELISWVKGNVINLHGAVLPDYKGAFTYNWGLFNLEKEWGATAHYVNEKFDEGDIIAVSRFEIIPEIISVKELEEKTQENAYRLTLSIVDEFRQGNRPKASKQEQRGKYYSRNDFESLKRIGSTDPQDVIKRKIHSCWCPPYEGAYIELDGERYYLLDKKTLENL